MCDRIAFMIKIRLQRVGRKNIPIFRIVVTDSKNSTKSGKYLEVVGSFDPVRKVKVYDAERIKHWISKGAQLSDTLHNFFVGQKVIEGKKRNVLSKRKPVSKKGLKEGAPKEQRKAVSETAEAEVKTEEVAVPAPETIAVV